MTIALGLAVLAAGVAQGATIAYSGTFATDDQVEQRTFQLLTDSTVELRSWSYAGGVNGNGQTIAPGGFDTYLSLFDASGMQILLALNEDRSGVCGVDNAADPVTGGCLDAGITATLPAGQYIAVITQSGNSPLGPTLADGFLMAGAGDYTGGPFLDFLGDQRTGDWAFEITGAVASEVPEPSTWAMILAGLALVRISSRKV
jgi:hypothetical protein